MAISFLFLESTGELIKKTLSAGGLVILMPFLFFSECYGDSLPQYKSIADKARIQEKEPKTHKTSLVSISKDSPNILTFTPFPFGRKAPKPKVDRFLAEQISKANKAKSNTYAKDLSEDSLVSFSGGEKGVDNEALVKHSDIPALTKESSAKVERQKATEVDVTYKVDETSHVRLAINSQDENSPIYTPLKKEEGVNAAGVYMGVDVSPSAKVYVGGEVRNNETVKENSPDSSSAGATLGVAFEF